jgi:hypothetical protein
MTVQELIDSLNNYIKKDPPDTWQLNDCDLDEMYYKERCQERANQEVQLVDMSTYDKDYRFEINGNNVISYPVDNKWVCGIPFISSFPIKEEATE